jgi:hypothetical protein
LIVLPDRLVHWVCTLSAIVTAVRKPGLNPSNE